MNRNSKRRRLVKPLAVLFVVLLGTLLALPTFFPVDPVLQIGNEDGSPLDASVVHEIAASLDAAAAPVRPPELDGGVVRLRFAGVDAQLRAGTELKAALPGRVIAFNLESRTPRWLTALGLRPVSLGLDLRGGVRFVYQLNFDALSRQLLEAELGSVRSALRDARIHADSDIEHGSIGIVLHDGNDTAAARRILKQYAGSFGSEGRLLFGESRSASATVFRLTPSEELLAARQEAAMQQNIVTLRNRVNELGVSEAVVRSQGPDRILVEVPGVQDPAQLDRILGSTATLEWRLEDIQHDARAAARTHRIPPGSILRYEKDGAPILLHREIIVSGAELTDASFGYVQGRPAVTVRLDAAGAERMRETTEHNVGRPLAVVFIEEQSVPVQRDGSAASAVSIGGAGSIDASGAAGSIGASGAAGSIGASGAAGSIGGEAAVSIGGSGTGTPIGSDDTTARRTKRTETVIFDGRIDNVLSNRFDLTGLLPTEARDLALLLRAGALAAPIHKVESGTASPTLGRDNIAKGRLALIAGFVSVVVFMAWIYRVFGLIADLALLANLFIVIGLLSLLSASLTLTGMAGLVLTVGMAVDANVLIFERIREELARGRTPLVSIEEGYSKAFATIVDSHVTTLIAGGVLFAFGSGPVKGFAVTLSLGILTSMFTSVVGTRTVIDLLYRGRSPDTLPIGGRFR